MSEYLVKWIIDISAEDPIDAARIARLIQMDRESSAVVFQVKNTHTDKISIIDLDDMDNKGD